MNRLWAACDDGCSTRVNEKSVAQRQLASQVSNGENFQNLTGNQTDRYQTWSLG